MTHTDLATAQSAPSHLTTARAFELISDLEKEIGRIIVGQHLLVRRLLTGLFASIPYAFSGGQVKAGCGHVLLEGVPGVAKTLTATTLAHGISAAFQRIQLTPDMLPADILGTRVYEVATATFRIEKGPVFTNILLADEINRATPKTQSALLEAMQERQVTLADTTFRLSDPFWVLATQNPVEQEGVYTLPEAQLDRFCMMLRVGYPSAEDELRMLHYTSHHLDHKPHLTPADVTDIRKLIEQAIHIDDKVREYIVRLGRATRAPADVGLADLGELIVLGISPRSYQHVLALSRVNAFLHGRDYVLPVDVKEIFPDTARHRIARSVRAEAEGVTTDTMVAQLVDAVPDPVARMLPDHIVRQLRYIELNTAKRIRTLRVGTYTSRLRGSGFDFDQHQIYREGDDVRRIDWNVTARMNAPYVRETHADRELNVVVALDLSRSMQFGTGSHSKKEMMLLVAACLVFSAVADQVNTGFLAFTDRVLAYRPPKRARARAWTMLEEIWALEPQGKDTKILPAARFLSGQLKAVTIVFIVSDFMTGEDLDGARDLKALAVRHDVVGVVLEDPAEMALLPGSGAVKVRDLETGRETRIGLSDSLRHDYDAMVQQRRKELIRMFYRTPMDHVFLRSGQDVIEPLMRLFATRRHA